MNALHATTIQQLLACDPQELEKVAAANQVSSQAAASARLFWRRKLTGKCLLCGTSSGGDNTCKKCSKYSGDPNVDGRSSVGLLSQLKPRDVLMKQRCVKCTGTIEQTVGYVLSMVKKYGDFKPSHVCKACKTKKHSEPLRQTPFRALEALKSEKRGSNRR